ncbi:cobalamin B12-binding domain-containing protein [Pseudobacteriovorax antillogorgiicola]|uniref:Methanogenic corrinoid protein MtbC1 n=1 Tax=Pseudobacteriovorax antillogorgiicola TaxID=1513793 RepID=A0A1Y6BVI7_9BACT|nr:cobalamin B12-binding domain-containing protein [Pseudobacteriovorax antillogorgiicola]TCS52980.1 methanogenic corrinoid protein MtbC1 [Pseudobacteriovorax antillogorgiicola]SMF27369.1 Methanogenic corrinoid protein MtbC1 [Pseudobacteriovorax antillogorgiicola]
MILWCCGCQKYLGEKQPYDDYSFTHSLCRGCFKKATKEERDPGWQTQDDALRDIFHDYLNRVQDKEDIDLQVFIKSAIKTGFGPIELFYLTVQPVLYDIGMKFFSGEVTYEQERMFTRFAEKVLNHIYLNTERPHAGPYLALVCADSNSHSIGIRALALRLMSEGIRCDLHLPQLNKEKIIDIAKNRNLHGIGLSVATMEQLADIPELLHRIRKSNPGIAILLGGPVIDPQNIPHPVDFVHDRSNFSALLEFLHASYSKDYKPFHEDDLAS